MGFLNPGHIIHVGISKNRIKHSPVWTVDNHVLACTELKVILAQMPYLMYSQKKTWKRIMQGLVLKKCKKLMYVQWIHGLQTKKDHFWGDPKPVVGGGRGGWLPCDSRICYQIVAQHPLYASCCENLIGNRVALQLWDLMLAIRQPLDTIRCCRGHKTTSTKY